MGEDNYTCLRKFPKLLQDYIAHNNISLWVSVAVLWGVRPGEVILHPPQKKPLHALAIQLCMYL